VFASVIDVLDVKDRVVVVVVVILVFAVTNKEDTTSLVPQYNFSIPAAKPFQ